MKAASTSLAPAAPGPRLAVVLSHPTQYYSPWFRWLAAHGRTLRVFYLWDFGVTEQRDRQFGTTFRWDVDLLSGYEYEFVPNTAREPGTHRFGGLRNPSLTARLAAWRPEAILLFGYKYDAHLQVILWAQLRGIPLLFRGDSHLLGRGVPSLPARLALWVLFRQFSAFLPVGVANRDYLRALGVSDDRMHFAPHAVDAGHFQPGPGTAAAGAELRRSLGIPEGALVVLFSGKLVAAKAPARLLAAFLALGHPDAVLVIAGQGEEEASLRTQARIARPGQVHFLPFANQAAMPGRYAMADLFALPSEGTYETWGLAVNEAMHLGVPALVSDRVGCQQDLVEPGVTGWVFPAGDEAALRATLGEALAALARDRAGWGRRARERVSRYSYAAAAAGLATALAAVRGMR